MHDPLEIIVTTTDNPTARKVPFEALFPIRQQIASMMFLWNTNSYFVNVAEKSFMINGGRKLAFPALGDCDILYRKRSAVILAVTGSKDGSEKKVSWIIGLSERGTERLIFLLVEDGGKTWQWANKL